MVHMVLQGTFKDEDYTMNGSGDNAGNDRGVFKSRFREEENQYHHNHHLHIITEDQVGGKYGMCMMAVKITLGKATKILTECEVLYPTRPKPILPKIHPPP